MRILLALSLLLCLSGALPCRAETAAEALADRYAEASALAAKGDVEKAAAIAEAFPKLEAWKQGDPLAAAALRGIADDLEAAGRGDLAKKVLAAGTASEPQDEDFRLALGARSLAASEAYWRRTPVFLPRADAWPAPFHPSRDLKRVMVGNQAGLVKILDGSGKQLFFKGIDSRMFAPTNADHRLGIRRALGIQEQAVPAVLDDLMRSYSTIPKRPALALMGALGSDPALPADVQKRLLRFLTATMRTDSDVVNRRQALLALAVVGAVDPRTVDEVIAFYAGSENRWETFPVQQFFEYHAAEIKAWPDLASIRSRIEAIDVFYTPHILGYLS